MRQVFMQLVVALALSRVTGPFHSVAFHSGRSESDPVFSTTSLSTDILISRQLSYLASLMSPGKTFWSLNVLKPSVMPAQRPSDVAAQRRRPERDRVNAITTFRIAMQV